jgi:hypothetical protein
MHPDAATIPLVVVPDLLANRLTRVDENELELLLVEELITEECVPDSNRLEAGLRSSAGPSAACLRFRCLSCVDGKPADEDEQDEVEQEVSGSDGFNVRDEEAFEVLVNFTGGDCDRERFLDSFVWSVLKVTFPLDARE